MPTMDIALADAPSPSVLAALLGEMPEPSGRDRRVHERLGAHELDWLKSARLRFGPVLSLIDLSAGGALFETSAPLRPGSNAVLTISGRGVTETASFRVLRCEVASLQQGLVYRGACVFDRMIQIPGTPSQGSVTLREDTASLDEVVKLIRIARGPQCGSGATGPGHRRDPDRRRTWRVTGFGAAFRGTRAGRSGRRPGPGRDCAASQPQRAEAGVGGDGRAELRTCGSPSRARAGPGRRGGAGATVAARPQRRRRRSPPAPTRPPVPHGTSWSCVISTEPCSKASARIFIRRVRSST